MSTLGFSQLNFIDLSNMNLNRGAISSTTDGSNIYVCGGYTNGLGSTSQVEKYNISSNSWTLFSNTSLPIRFSSAEVVGNKLYIWNGLSNNSAVNFNNKIETIYIPTGTIISSIDNPLPVYAGGSSVWQGNIYSFGGTSNLTVSPTFATSGDCNKLYMFDTTLQIWIELANMPQSKETKGEIVDGKLYTIGGFSANVVSTSIDRYDIQTNTWTHMMDMPVGISGHSTSVYQNKIWCVGDYSNQTSIGYYDIDNNQFVSLSNNMIGRRHAGSVTLNNKLYVFGGNQTSMVNTSLNSLQFTDISNYLVVDVFSTERNNIYPNPTSGNLYLSTNTDKNIKIYDMIGNKVIDKDVTNFLDTSNLSNGIYLCEITEGENKQVKKIIKK